MNRYEKALNYTLSGALCAALLIPAGCASERNNRPPLEIKAAGLESSGIDAFGSGDYRAALNKFTEALAVNRGVDNRQGELADLINIGRVLILLGEHGVAVSYLQEAITLASGIKDDAGLSEARSTLAKACYFAGDNAKALAELDEALAIDARLGRNSAAGLNLKASIYADAGKTDEAKELLKKALNDGEGGNPPEPVEAANALRLLAALESATGNRAQALTLYERAYEYDKAYGDPLKIALDLKNMAELHLKEGRARDAAFLFDRHYTVANAAGLFAEAAGSLEELINIYAASGDHKKAQEYTRRRDAVVSGMKAREERGGAEK